MPESSSRSGLAKFSGDTTMGMSKWSFASCMALRQFCRLKWEVEVHYGAGRRGCYQAIRKRIIKVTSISKVLIVIYVKCNGYIFHDLSYGIMGQVSSYILGRCTNY